MTAELVIRARNGDQQAWDALVEEYSPLIWSICRRHRLAGADAEDVGQCVWLHLVDKLAGVRDPAALPGWLATTTRRECLRVLRAARGPLTARPGRHTDFLADQQTGTAEQEVLVAERHAALREAFTHLPLGCQQLLTLLTADPPVSYTEISARLGIPIGTIGPTRARCLDKLRRYPAIAALIDAGDQTTRPVGETTHRLCVQPPCRAADLAISSPRSGPAGSGQPCGGSPSCPGPGPGAY
jgi:RNA polymerase sigma factor (sigma-70 family)